MKYVKIILGTIAGLVILLLIIAAFVPKTYTVSVSETINRPRQEVYDYVRILENQRQYSVWVMADPDLNPVITGTDGTVGAIQKWNSKINDVGEGEQEITALSQERIDVDLRFKRPMESEAKAAMILNEDSENQTQIISEFYGSAPYPFNLMAYTLGRRMIREAQQKNLSNIKNILEKN